MESRRRSQKRSRKVLVSGAVIGIAGAGIAWTSATYPWLEAASQRDRAFADAKAAGVVTTEAEFMRVVGKADPTAVQATKKLGEFVRGRSPMEKAAYDIAVQSRRQADVSKALAIHVPAIEASEALGASPHLFADRDFSNPVMTLFPEYSNLKLGAKLLALRCEVRARKGDLTGTLQDLQAMEGLAKAAAAEPLLISQLVSCSLSAIRLDALNVAANALAADRDALRTLQAQVAATRVHADTVRALHGETYLGTYIAKNLTKEMVEMTSTSPERLLPKFVPIGIVRRAYEARMLALFAKAARAPKGERWRVLTDARRAAARSKEPTDQIIGDVLPIFEGTDVTVQSTATKVKILGALLAIAEKRAASDEWPQGWGEVPGGAPLSPLGGKPLRFKVEGEKLTVYSIGLDGVDETERAPLFPEKSDDLSYEWTAQE